MVLVFTQVWGYANDPGFTPRSRGFVANPENPPLGSSIFSFSPILAGAVQRERAPCFEDIDRWEPLPWHPRLKTLW